MKDKLTRKEALKNIVVLPALAAALGAGLETPVLATDNKKQFHYQDHPNMKGQKCSGCRSFKKPDGCKIVTGKISSNGWCVAWVRR